MAKKVSIQQNPGTVIKNAPPPEVEVAWHTWADGDEKGRVAALKESSKCLESCVGIVRSGDEERAVGSYRDIAPGIHGRPSFGQDDYNLFRPGEATPKVAQEIIRKCDIAYQKVGVVKNIIDLMGDFGCQGIRLNHPNKKIQEFYRNWFKKVKGKERSERFLNLLYRAGTVIVRRQTAKINVKVKDRLYKSHADDQLSTTPFVTNDPPIESADQPKGPDLFVNKLDTTEVEAREIPWQYTFIDAAITIPIGGSLGSFVGDQDYAIVLPVLLRKMILSPVSKEQQELVKRLPKDIINAAKTRLPYLLPRDKISVFYYKKDDWQAFGYPMIYPILDDINLLRKLKQADASALDGAISNIRLIKLGSMEHRIAPSRAAMDKLAAILASHTGTGTMDLIWGDDIEMVESKTEVHKFLGKTKYQPTNEAINSGLGIPTALTGSGSASTTFLSLKTLTERLQYGRDRLIEFWENEIILLQKAMGFKFPATLEFDIISLSDESSIKSLFIQLADRNLISDEAIQRVFGQDPELETARLNREEKLRDANKLVPKAGPFFDPQLEAGLKKIALQNGSVAPSQVGLNLHPKKNGEKSLIDIQQKHEADMQDAELPISNNPVGKPGGSAKKGQPQQGRPKNSKDTNIRKKRTFKPKSSAMIEFWARAAQQDIAEILNPGFLQHYDKKNMRSLTHAETQESEKVKFGVLSYLEPMTKVTPESVQAALQQGEVPFDIKEMYDTGIAELARMLKREPTLEEARQVQVTVYSYIKGEDDGESND